VIVFLIIDGVLYFLFLTFASDPLNWILLIPFVLVELLFIFVTLMLLSVPLAVFLKYHLLSFLETWFAGADIPFFDKTRAGTEIEPKTELETGPGTKLNESNESEQYSSEKGISEQRESELPSAESGDSGNSGGSGSPVGSEPKVTHDF
ncbi:MAG: hypothetical protein QG610_1363, partial [Euryarchaeota archaeon]|nr:hypothetical protein [Euryarchaeota archaeon]